MSDAAPPRSPRIVVRRATLADVPAIAACLGDPAVQPQLLQVPYRAEARVRGIVEASDERGSHDVMLVAELDGRVVGNAGLHAAGPQLRRRHAMSLGISVLPEAWGQGVGPALMQALVDYADRWGHVLRIELTVYCDNIRAIALYERFGFVREGRHVAYALRDGRYIDAFAMARLHPSPPTLPAAA